MYSIKRLIAMSLPVAALVVLSTSAHAATETFSYTIPTGDYPDVVSFTMPSFDSSLGTLTGVQLNMATSILPGIFVTNTNSTSYAFTDGAAALPFQIALNANSADQTKTTSTISGEVSGTATPGTSGPYYDPDGVDNESKTYNVGSGDFSLYVGTGSSTVAFTSNATGSSAGATYVGSPPANTISAGPAGTVNGTFEVTYTFTSAASAPEPGALALAIPGILGVVGMGIRRRRSAK